MAELELGGDHPEATSEHKPKGKLGKLFHGKRGVFILIGAVAVVVFGYLLIRRSASNPNNALQSISPNPQGPTTSSDAFQSEGVQSQLGNLTDQLATEFQANQNQLASLQNAVTAQQQAPPPAPVVGGSSVSLPSELFSNYQSPGGGGQEQHVYQVEPNGELGYTWYNGLTGIWSPWSVAAPAGSFAPGSKITETQFGSQEQIYGQNAAGNPVHAWWSPGANGGWGYEALPHAQQNNLSIPITFTPITHT